ncbi:hypothetical protein DFH28DRAFT_959414 [Melampsora americana]|nr:hypothetical protein DFH28DRAFT_959414 [Melampsora americana]
MSFTNLGLNLTAMSVIDTWFYLKQAVLRNANDINLLENSTTSQNNFIQSYPWKLFPSNKLLTWTPELNKSFDDQVLSETDGAKDECDPSFDPLFNFNSRINKFGVLKSSSSSISLDSLSCYSVESGEETNTDESESSLNSLFEDDCSEDSVLFKNLKNSSRSITDSTCMEIRSLETRSVKNRSWNEQINYLATDEEWDDHINELAEEFEKEFEFDSECKRFEETLTRISAAFDCDEEEEEEMNIGEFEEISLSQEDGSDESFNSLFDDEESMINEIDNSNNSEEIIKDLKTQSNDYKLSDEEKEGNRLLSLYRQTRAIRKNPHLSHLFY